MPTKLKLLDLLKLLKKLKGLLEIDTSEEGLRIWLRSLVEFGDFLADLTGTTWDDDALDILRHIVESDEVYAAIYQVIDRILRDVDPADPLPGDAPLEIIEENVRSAMNRTPGVQTALTGPATAIVNKPGIPVPWVTIIAVIVKIILAILDRRQS